MNVRNGATVSEVTEQIKLPRTTTYRILETLSQAGYVYRDPTDDRYRLIRAPRDELFDVLLDRGMMWGYLIEGHGMYAWGRDMAEARRHLEAFEFLINCELEMRKLRP